MAVLFDETLRRNVLDSQGKHLRITETEIQYGDKRLSCEEITDVSETLNAVTINGAVSGDTYTIELKDQSGNKIEMGLSSFMNPTDTEGVYLRVHGALQKAVYSRILEKLEKIIDAGGEIKKGQVKIRKDGLQLERGLIFKAYDTILWPDLKTVVRNGNLELRSASQPGIQGQIMLHLWNAVVIRMLIEKRAGH